MNFQNPSKEYQLYFCLISSAFHYRVFLRWDHYAWKSLDLGLRVYDSSLAHGHLRCQNQIFGCILGY
jgi:hypothetical protein